MTQDVATSMPAAAGGSGAAAGSFGPAIGVSGEIVLRTMRIALHSGFLVLWLVGTIRLLVLSLSDRPESWRLEGWLPLAPARGWIGLVLALVLLIEYAGGQLLQRTWPRSTGIRRDQLRWLALVTSTWAILLIFSADFSWLAFPLFFLHLHLLRRRHAILAVTVMTIVVVFAQWWHANTFQLAMLIGPAIGAAFSVVIAIGYGTLYTEAERRRASIEELRATRAELARSEHSAGRLAERERLAREIHDTLAQGLSSIVLLNRSADGMLSQFRTSGDREPLTRARALLAEAGQTASDNLAEARRFIRDLTPPDLADGSLLSALRRLGSRAESDAVRGGQSLQVVIRTDGAPMVLPAPYEVTLLRAAQASVANVLQHAAADTVVVTVGYLSSEVTLDIFDNGVGFDPGTLALAGNHGFGLIGLRERVLAAGGLFDVESTPGEGAVVAIRLPLEGDIA